ncbi:exosome complex component CSL4-like isoform X1 [Sycon ciliatum]|uniref:exosome complex component CSL4-like isoform X1 n=1 Tax=Sycon ciliatum TaxID=27933 RepID=UPI0031F615C6|eukprot:scpid41666/ scgid5410/ Exosome complex component CSL4; Exosome component 1
MEVVIPGERLGASCEYSSGFGTYVRHGYVYASMAGFRSVVDTKNGQEISVYHDASRQRVVPVPGSLVTCRVTSTNPRHCKVSILRVGETSLKESFRGLIRKEDVRAVEKDKVEIYKCFRPGDIVLAKVNSLGDVQSYLLTTAETTLGVIYAVSEVGVPMTAVSWAEMQCPKSKVKQFRKVAKVDIRQVPVIVADLRDDR